MQFTEVFYLAQAGRVFSFELGDLTFFYSGFPVFLEKQAGLGTIQWEEPHGLWGQQAFTTLGGQMPHTGLLVGLCVF